MTHKLAPEPFHAPASFAQQRLWFLQALEPKSEVNNIAEALRLRGPLQIPILEQKPERSRPPPRGIADDVYAGTVTLFRAGLRSWGSAAVPDLGWGRLAEGGVEVREVPGGHVDMLLPPHVEALAVELRAAIDAAIQVAEGSEPEPEAVSAQ